MRNLNSSEYFFQDKKEDANYTYYLLADESGKILFVRLKKDETEMRVIRANKTNYTAIWNDITSQPASAWKRIFE